MARPARAARADDLTLTDRRLREGDVPVVRFSDADFAKYGAWLLERMRKNFKHLNDNQHFSHLRMCLTSSEYYFVRTENAVALAQLYLQPLDPSVYARTIFIYSMEARYIHEAEALVRNIMIWAKHAGAIKLEFGLACTLTAEDIERVVPEITVWECPVVTL